MISLVRGEEVEEEEEVVVEEEEEEEEGEVEEKEYHSQGSQASCWQLSVETTEVHTSGDRRNQIRVGLL